VAEKVYDVVVIGGGPGGYVAAIRAAQLGLKVACVEAQKLGGVCNNWGCIPTKAMLESANYARTLTNGLGDFGIEFGDLKLDIGTAAKRAGKIADSGAKGVSFLFRKNKIDHIEGWGRLLGDGKIEIDPGKNAGHGDEKPSGKGKKEVIEAKNIILATGSRPRELPILKIDGDRVWSSDHAVYAEKAPKSLAVIGGGAIGLEFADVFNSFGTEVTVIEAMDHILPLEDPDVARVVERAFKKRGMKVLSGAMLEKADVSKKGVKLTVKVGDKKETIEVERVLSAVGRVPVIEDIGLEAAGVKTENGFIAVDEKMRTNVEGIFAIGDCAKPPLLAHKASHEGVAAAEFIAGDPNAGVDYNNIPSVTYCHPEVASVGMTEAEAKEAGYDIEVGSFPWSASGRARTMGDTDGFVKVIRDKKYSELLGAHIVGPHASELIAEFVVGRHLETTVEEMNSAIHPHPTLSESAAEAALAALGRAINM